MSKKAYSTRNPDAISIIPATPQEKFVKVKKLPYQLLGKILATQKERNNFQLQSSSKIFLNKLVMPIVALTKDSLFILRSETMNRKNA